MSICRNYRTYNIHDCEKSSAAQHITRHHNFTISSETLQYHYLTNPRHFRCNIMWRWAYDPENHVSSLTHWGTLLPFHWFYRPIVGRLLRFQAFMQGIGRHKQPEVLVMGNEDLQALSVYLGILKMSFSCIYQTFNWLTGVR